MTSNTPKHYFLISGKMLLDGKKISLVRSAWQWWLAGDVCGNVMVTDEIWRGDYHCRGGLHITQTKYSYLNNISLEIIYDGGFT